MDSVLKGNTGEYYVLAELSRRGWIAAQTPRNSRAYDVLARKGDRQVGIRVKTKTSDARIFQWNAKHDGEIFLDIGANDFCALVEIPDGDAYPLFYIVPTETIREWLTGDFKTWVSTPGARGQQRSVTNKRRVFYLDGDETKTARGYRKKLQAYLGRWDSLERAE
ncbi:MAG TPA: hypothetical protein VJ233_17485 [Hyphomicrobiaceae bacterium]|nr:hypothetical protein [Hyphomicrobiaceae bacterium]